jgi:IS605 OrfB family transposase
VSDIIKTFRVENYLLQTTPELRESMERMFVHYRRIIRLLCTVMMTHRPELAHAKSICQAVEALFLITTKRPIVKYPALYRAVGRMPCYLRRAAIEAAWGIVSSFLSNYSNWLDGKIGGKPREEGSRTPRFGISRVYPPLYGGNMIRPDKGLSTVQVKVLDANGQWYWSEPMPIKGDLKHLAPLGKFDFCPTLIVKGSKVTLACPVEVHAPKYLTNQVFFESKGKVCACDVGINTAVTAVIVAYDGTIVASKFFDCGKQNAQRDGLTDMIADKQKRSGGTVKGQPHCTTLHRRIAGLSHHAARTLASQVAEFAASYGVTVFVIEDLKGWRPKGPSRKMRKKFHRFQHRAIVKALEYKAQEMGARVLEIDPRGTSRYAFDGSGKVKRSKKNAQLATFTTGKQYNADRNGALNIAARGLAKLKGIEPEQIRKADTGKSSGSVARIPLVLADIWNYWQALRAFWWLTIMSAGITTLGYHHVNNIWNMCDALVGASI